jgi:ribosomal protein L7/L12
MNILLAVLEFTDFAVIAVIVIVFAGTASLATRQRLNLRRVERKLDALLQHHGIALPSKLSPEVQRLASDPNQKIAAIKLHREQTGLSLAEAKAEVEEFSN